MDITGEVDLHTAPKLRERIHELTEEGRDRIVLNLQPLSFMDSTGLGVLVAALKRIKGRDGELVLVAPQDPVRKVLQVTGLDKVFPIGGSVSEAVADGD